VSKKTHCERQKRELLTLNPPHPPKLPPTLSPSLSLTHSPMPTETYTHTHTDRGREIFTRHRNEYWVLMF
jgi:hypothetical protein